MKSIRIVNELNQLISRKSFNKSSSQRYLSNLLAKISQNNENLEVNYNNVSDKFPLVWLRDNCTCENCFHRPSTSRIIDWKDFNLNVKVKSIQTKDDSNIEINWNDDHKSVYSLDWLRKRSFLKENQKQYLKNAYIPVKKVWNKDEFSGILKKYDWSDIMGDDNIFYNWLMDLAVHGVALVKNVPQNSEECRKLSDRIAFIRKTHYGEDFHVIAKEGTNNVAYLSNNLQMHTDLPYYDYKPGVIFLHCIQQTITEGGENLLTDAFYVAEKLRKDNKEVFDVLSKTEVNWSDIGEEDGVKFCKLHRSPVISLNQDGSIRMVRHSIPQRDSYFTVDFEMVTPWYKALKIFIDELYDSAIKFKTQPGDILTIDNTRLVHGRTTYQDTSNVRRFLVGNYVDWDEIYSKLRILREELQK